MSSANSKNISAVLIGASQGGFEALRKALGPLPKDFPVPILVVRHQSPNADGYLLTSLNRAIQLEVKYGEHGETPRAGFVYVAPPDQHLLVGADGRLLLSHDPKRRFSRPSIDLLFLSAAAYYRDKALAIVLTGANEDGADGVVEIKKQGGLVLVQDPDSAEAPTMPEAALAAVEADYVVWGDQIGPHLWTLLSLTQSD